MCKTKDEIINKQEKKYSYKKKEELDLGSDKVDEQIDDVQDGGMIV